MSKLNPLSCPRCGNTTEQEGITHCYLEWRIVPVCGVDKSNDEIVLDYDANEGTDIDPNDHTTMTNVPNHAADLQHLFCNKCGWNWFDPRDDRDVESDERPKS